MMINDKLNSEKVSEKPQMLLFSKRKNDKLKSLNDTIRTIIQENPWFASQGILPVDNINQLHDFFEQLPRSYRPKDTVVAWDIDQTVLMPDSRVLRDINSQYNDLVEDVFKANCPNLDLMTEAYRQDNNQLLQPEIGALIQQTKSQGIHTMGLTSRKPTLVECRPGEAYLTDIHLKRLHLDFTCAFPRKYNDLDITRHFSEKSQSRGQKLFHNGVMMTSSSSKGESIKYLFNEMHYKPKCLVFVEDKISRLKEVRDYCAEHNIQFYGFHYRRFYQLDHTPNDKIVKHQIEHMIAYKIWLSDQEIQLSATSEQDKTKKHTLKS